MKFFLLALLALANLATSHPRVSQQENNLKTLTNEDTVQRESRIAGGKAATEGQFPYQVSIKLQELDTERHLCGGVIISENYVISTALCVNNQVKEDLIVVAGDVILTSKSTYEQIRDVLEVLVHADFDAATYLNDIALLKLSTPLTFDFGVNSILITQNPEPITDDCITLGWGITSANGEYSDTLQYISMMIYTDTYCSDYYGDVGPSIDAASSICAGGSKTTEDFCQGDEGGALTCNGYLHGISSWGYGCGKGFPGIFTQIYHFRTWITDNAS